MYSTRIPIIDLFEQIDREDHMERILFYQQYRRQIAGLDEETKYYLDVHYVASLFEAGKYQEVVNHLDPVIAYVFFNDIQYKNIGGYQDLLFIKAKSLLAILDFKQSINIVTQLIGINPDHKPYHQLLYKVKREGLHVGAMTIKFVALVLILIGALVSGLVSWISSSGSEQPLVKTFAFIVTPCILALVLLGGMHLYTSLLAKKYVIKVVQEKKKKNSL